MKPKLDIGRLCTAIQRSRMALRYLREQAYEMTAEYLGNHYSRDGARHEVPCNLLAQYVQIIGKKLVAHNPRVMLSTWSPKAQAVVGAMEDWVNGEIVKLNLVETLSEATIDAFFSIGIVQVGLATPGDAAISGWRVKAGDPYACSIHLDDFAFDIHCRKLREAGWMAHRYRVPRSAVAKLFKKGELAEEADRYFNQEGDQRISLLGRSMLGGQDEGYEDFVDLWQVYVARHKRIVTLSDAQLTGTLADSGAFNPTATDSALWGKALDSRDWVGSPNGPYHIHWLGSKVPGNPVPKAPLQDLYDLHLPVNSILRKLIWQCENYKRWTGVSGAASQDGSRMVEVNDGQVIRLDHPNQITVQESNVPSQQLYMMFEALRKLFSWLGGNLDVQGGLASDADTAHQESMLNENSSATILEMQQRTLDLASDVVRSLCWYWHHHPTKVMRAPYAVPGQKGMAVHRNIFPAGHTQTEEHQDLAASVGVDPEETLTRDHDWDVMDIKVDPHSMPHTTPGQRLAALNGIMQNIIIPLTPVLAQQGLTPDMQEYLEKVGKWMDEPALAEIMSLGQPIQPEQQSGTPDVGSPQKTTHEYTRRSKGSQGEQNSLMNMLTQGRGVGGSNNQPKPSMNGAA